MEKILPFQSNQASGWFYQASKQFLTLDIKACDFFEQKKRRIKNNVLRISIDKIKKLTVMLTSYDFSEFINSKMPKARISEPPRGALMLMMYIGLLGARAARAWERGKVSVNSDSQKRDLRELFDVIRRDVWGITFYLFGFGVVNNLLVKKAQNRSGSILRDSTGRIYTFSEHELNARLANADVLAAHYYSGNKKALVTAAQHNGYFGVPEKIKRIAPTIYDNLQKNITSFRTNLLQKNFKSCMAYLKELDQLREAFLNEGFHSNPLISKEIQKLKSTWPKYEDFLGNYLKHKRLPLDIFSFVILFLVMGYGPIWVNQAWTEYQYRKNKDIKQPT